MSRGEFLGDLLPWHTRAGTLTAQTGHCSAQHWPRRAWQDPAGCQPAAALGQIRVGDRLRNKTADHIVEPDELIRIRTSRGTGNNDNHYDLFAWTEALDAMCTFAISASSGHIRPGRGCKEKATGLLWALSESDSNYVKQVRVRPPATPLVVRHAKQPAVIARASQPSQFACGLAALPRPQL